MCHSLLLSGDILEVHLERRGLLVVCSIRMLGTLNFGLGGTEYVKCWHARYGYGKNHDGSELHYYG